MWDDIKDFIGGAAPVVGTLLGGPIGGSIGGLIANKLGVENDPKAILEKLQTDPEALIKIKQMESEERQQLRQLQYKATELEATERMRQHETTQKTIQVGDTAEDPYVRHTRPMMARWSFFGSLAYLFLFELLASFGIGAGANEYLLGILLGPSVTYMGVRTVDAFSKHKGPRMGQNISGIVSTGKEVIQKLKRP